MGPSSKVDVLKTSLEQKKGCYLIPLGFFDLLAFSFLLTHYVFWRFKLPLKINLVLVEKTDNYCDPNNTPYELCGTVSFLK